MIQNLALAFTAVFVALDIIGTLPMFVSMTHRMSGSERNRIVNTSMLVALAVGPLLPRSRGSYCLHGCPAPLGAGPASNFQGRHPGDSTARVAGIALPSKVLDMGRAGTLI